MEFKELKEKVIENIEKLIEIDKSEFEGRNREKLINFRNELERELTFKVLCLGDFNSGKTTFVNRFFLEEDLLPTGIIPTTAKLTVIKYSNEKKVEINSGDESVIISDNIAEKLKDILTKKSDSKTVVIVNYPSNMLKEGIEVIDSPGLNDPDEERMDVTYKIIDSVDCILYFLTAHQVWKRSEKEFLEKIKEAGITNEEYLKKCAVMREIIIEYVNLVENDLIKIYSLPIGLYTLFGKAVINGDINGEILSVLYNLFKDLSLKKFVSFRTFETKNGKEISLNSFMRIIGANSTLFSKYKAAPVLLHIAPLVICAILSDNDKIKKFFKKIQKEINEYFVGFKWRRSKRIYTYRCY